MQTIAARNQNQAAPAEAASVEQHRLPARHGRLPARHQYIDRATGEVRTERLYHDPLIRMLYGAARENAPLVFNALVRPWMSRVLGFLNYDMQLGARISGNRRFLEDLGVDLTECVEPLEKLNTARRIFERQIRYLDVRPMPQEPEAVVCPADARALVGSLNETSLLCLKDKFFRLTELLGTGRGNWHNAFAGGDYAVFRLTPDKYHYNHCPVSGIVIDIYQVDGLHHSCNPGAVVAVATPYSANQRVVTVIDTDVPGGTKVGRVAMIEVVALMIGEITQCYSDRNYDDPRDVCPGLSVRRGQPKSLYRPGSSTNVLVFEPGRIEFAADLTANLNRPAESRFSAGFGRPLVETDVAVRSLLARPKVSHESGATPAHSS